jgi:hypothetical protein
MLGGRETCPRRYKVKWCGVWGPRVALGHMQQDCPESGLMPATERWRWWYAAHGDDGESDNQWGKERRAFGERRAGLKRVVVKDSVGAVP